MSLFAIAIIFTLVVWWLSTGLIVYLDGLPEHTFRWSMLGASVLLILALLGLWASSAERSLASAFCAFTCAVLVWGWQEMSFLMGYLTGPRKSACPRGARGWLRARYAFEAILYHELVLLALAAAVVAVTWSGTNKVGLWTFLILWVMRQSAKLNVFLGVRNLNKEFLPRRIRYLASYFTKRWMNPLFPFVVTLASIATALFWQAALAAPADSFQAAGFALLATLMTLAVLEHWLLMLPLPSARLWRWAFRSHERSAAAREAGAGRNTTLLRTVQRPLPALAPDSSR
jgi:putative photosynthetic complex assembly protein 2